MDRPVALLCNPSAGGGRAQRLLPRAERALRDLGVSFHSEVTRDLDHGCALARQAAQAGEVVVTLSGDGLIGCVVGVLREFPVRLAPDARLDDGLLDVVVIGRHSKRSFLVTLPKAFTGTHVRHPAISIRRARELRVDADRPFEIYADGDPIAATPATIRVVPHALRVLVEA